MIYMIPAEAVPFRMSAVHFEIQALNLVLTVFLLLMLYKHNLLQQDFDIT